MSRFYVQAEITQKYGTNNYVSSDRDGFVRTLYVNATAQLSNTATYDVTN